jgi:mannonate dehydratase
MKITDIKVIVTSPSRNFVLVKIFTDEPGLYGVGDATLNGRELAVAALINDHLKPLLIGKDPDQIEDIWQYIQRGSYWRNGPVLMTGLAGIDIALWDIKGKRAGLPLYSLLGGKCRNGVLCYTHSSGEDIAEATDSVADRIEKGFKVVRSQVGIKGAGLKGSYGIRYSHLNRSGLPEEQVWEPGPYLRIIPKLFEHLRVTFGEEIELLHDAHERCTPIEAGRLLKELEPYHLFYLEDPIRPEHKESFRRFRNYSTTPIAMGELFSSKWDCLTLITEQLVDFVRCTVTHIGGITEAKKLAAIAEPYQVKMAFQGPPDISPIAHAANVHLDLAIPNFGVQEWTFHDDPVHEVISGAPVFVDGYLKVGDAPGLGCDINEKLAQKYPYRRAYLPTCRRMDGSVQDW